MIKEKPNTIFQTAEMEKSGAPKIFLLYASAGAGHHSACDAVRQSIADNAPEADIRMIDILNFMPRPLARLYSGGYLVIVGKYPMLWYFIYESGSDLSGFKPPGFWHRIFWQALLNPLFKFLQKERPDQIISSHFLSSWAAGLYKLKYDYSCKVSTIITDYGVHPVWIAPGQDYVFVATEQLKAELLPFTHYLGTDKIIPVGIPIHPEFGRDLDIQLLKQKYQLDPRRYTILILGGMFGSRNLMEILYWLHDCVGPLQIILVAGRHYPVPEYIKEHLVEKNIKYHFFGYIDFMNELMAISDLAITKAGALTTSECMASGLPLVIFKPYPGQEVRNCDYFLEKGAALRVDQLSGLCYKIDSILLEPGRLEQMRNRARNIARPESSENIAKILLDLPVEVSKT